ncbi:MAG: TerC family protein [Saprospiraceae bacterium]|nr:TerC family protein [Saprospiraceae bacterium]
MLPDFSSSEIWISMLTLTFLEIVLGIDNIIFVSIIANRLDISEQSKARSIGLLLAMLIRIALLFGIAWIINATQPLFTIPFLTTDGQPIDISIKDLILMAGGLFLLAKSTSEIHDKLEGEDHQKDVSSKAGKKLGSVIIQITLINIVFSFDSILTAVGLTKEISVMMIAVILSILVMMAFSGPVSRFINKHPTLQILALSFLILIGFMLVAESLHQHVPKGYIYFSILFSLLVEILNMKMRKKQSPIMLHGVQEEATEEGLFENDKMLKD